MHVTGTGDRQGKAHPDSHAAPVSPLERTKIRLAALAITDKAKLLFLSSSLDAQLYPGRSSRTTWASARAFSLIAGTVALV